jgi:hypothetical protein
MLLDQATAGEMQAARILMGATMVGFLAAATFRRQARNLRIVIAGLYIAGVLGFIVYSLF